MPQGTKKLSNPKTKVNKRRTVQKVDKSKLKPAKTLKNRILKSMKVPVEQNLVEKLPQSEKNRLHVSHE